MLQITIPAQEIFDERTNEFVYTKEYNLRLEHSLVSISKWESKFCKPFLTKEDKTTEETIEYIKCMTITQNIPSEAYNFLTQENMNDVIKYIESPMTATWFSNVQEEGKAPSKEVITSELIYYWMITLQIPVEFQTWHLNRLLTLIRICNVKNQPEKKMNRRDIAARNAKLNAQRRAAMKSRG